MSDLARDTNVPANDCISRQAAIDAVNTALFPKINTAKDAEKALMGLPSAQPEQRWIPCDDCDPEESGYYIVTEKIAEDVWKVGLRWYSTEHGWHWSENLILAWMPLPESWKGES